MTAPPALLDRFALLIEGLCRGVAASHSRGVAGPLIVLIWGRLRRMAARFAAGAARTPAEPRAASGPAAAVSRPSRRAVPVPRQRLPGGFAWLVRLAPEAACYGGQLQALLADPDVAALLAAAPQMGRVLRPLCRMLGVAPPPELRLPKRPRTPAPSARTTAPGRADASVSPTSIPVSRWRPQRPGPLYDWERQAGIRRPDLPEPA